MIKRIFNERDSKFIHGMKSSKVPIYPPPVTCWSAQFFNLFFINCGLWKFKEKYTLFCLSVLLSTTSLTCQIDFYLAMSYAKKVQLLIGNELNTVWSIWVRRAELKNKPLRLWLGLADLKQTQNWKNCFPCTLKNKVSCSPCIKMLQMAALGSEIMIMIIITVIGT